MTEPERPAGARQSERRATLSHELSDLLIELSIALHKYAMYPEGHPSLVPAADGVAQRLDRLLEERGTLSLGVARDQLIIEGVATDPKHPVLQDLAERLHRHHLGAIAFSRGCTGAQLEQALKVVAAEADRMAEPIGLRAPRDIPAWPNIRLYPITFERLELVGGPQGEGGAEVSGGRSAQLWVGLARAALAAEEQEKPPPAPMPEPFAFRPEPQPLTEAEIDQALSEVHAGPIEHEAAEPAAVAKAIEAHERGTAYDQVIVGYMLQIADQLKSEGGSGAVALKKKMSRLIGELDQRTLTRLLEMGGDANQRRQFLWDASQGMAADAVVDLIRAAADTGAPISNAMLRMLQKLGHHAERGPAPRREIAETALRDQVAELLKGWSLADPNPDGYALALQRMSTTSATLMAADEAAYAPESDRLVRMAIEAGGFGVIVRRAIDELVVRGRVGDLLDILQQAPKDNAATAAIRERVVEPAMLKLVLSTATVDFALVDRLVDALGARAVPAMLDVLAESESRQMRRGLIDRLLRHPEDLRPELPGRLADERWYVVRNILYLAAELPGPAAVDAAAYRRHEDARVRREALRVLFKHPVERTRAICTALTDADSKVIRLALSALSDGGVPEPAVPLLITLAADSEQDSELRVPAIRALGARGGPLALDALLRLTEPKRRSLIAVVAQSTGSTPEYLAALAVLGGFRSDARARERLTGALKSRDPAAQKIAADALRGGS